MTGLALTLGPLVMTLATPSQPGLPCHVQLVPADAPPVWVSAASALEQVLRTASPGDRDCRDVVIRADRRSVEVTTADGRRGSRALDGPVDLEPTVAALIVTVPAAVEEPAVAAPAPPPAGWRSLLFAGGGARYTFPGTPAPVVEGMLGAARGSWEAGLYGAWSPTVLAVGTTQAPVSSTAEIGLGAARRQPVRTGALLLGARAGVARLSPAPMTGNVGMGAGPMNPAGGGTEPALSVFIGGVVPVLRYLRVRTQLSLQWSPVPGDTNNDSPPSNQPASIWSVGLNVGAESGIP